MLVSSSPARLRFVPSWAIAIVVALVCALGLVAVPGVAQATEPIGADTGLSVTSTGDTVLAGGEGRVTVRAVNDDGDDLYNATAVVVLPVGVTYVGGSATPGGANGVGEPAIRWWTPDPDDIDPDSGEPYRAQVLVWENVADLPVGASTEVSFAIEADNGRYPVGSSFAVGSGVYANSNERLVPTVTVPASGAPIVTGATEGDSVDATVTVIALSVSKAETANPEAEVYRGPANPATFTVTVRTAPQAGTDGVVVTDLVPATFTVLGCDDGDYTCRIVEIEGEVFTELTWDLGNVAAGRTIPLTYDAYVALREVTLPDATEPGAPTRPTTGGYGVTNTVEASGTYTGDVAAGGTTEITTSAETTVTVLDVGIVKSVASGTFTAGSTIDYSFTVRTSEYVDASGITVVDTIPDGMCPVLAADMDADVSNWPEECADAASGGGSVTGEGTMTSADFDATSGTFTVSFSIEDRDEDEDATVEYSVFMREFYQDGSRTSVGDGFTNSVRLTGTVDPVAGNDVDSGSAPGDNDSSATVGTSNVSLVKSVWTNPDRERITGVSGTGTTCTATGDYTTPTGTDVPALQLGDLVCFRIDADFPAGVATRDVQISDFLPMGAAMIAWSATTGAGWTTVEGLGTDPATATRWRLGEQTAGSYYVAPGDDAQLYVLARIDSVPEVQPQVTGNLAKMRYTSGDGTIVALRDDVDLKLAPAPPLSLDKKVNGRDSLSPVQEGQDLAFTIEVSHDGTPEGLNDYPLDQIEVWDVLPAGFDCDDITDADPAITAANCTTQNGRTVVTWVLDLSAEPLRGGESTEISYQLAVPSPLSIDSSHTNTAAVTRFTAVSTNGLDPDAGGAVFYPDNPVGAYEDEENNAAQASDSTTITLAGATVAKSVVTTGVTETNNSERGQATIGETVTWEYSATIPAKTSVFNGILDDQAPIAERWTAVGLPTFTTTSADAVAAAGCARDADEFRLCTDTANARFGDLLFPASWTNDESVAVTFTVTLTMRVTDVAANSHGAALGNTAVLTSTPTTTDSGAVERARATASVTVVVPAPTIAKEQSLTAATGPWSASNPNANGGQTVYYRLTVGNGGSGRPPLHETVVVDCIDSRMTSFTNHTSPSVATVAGPVTGDGTNGCAVGRTRYTWTLANDLGTTAAQIVYSAQVPTPIPASNTFRNDATVTGTTMPGAVAGERTLTATADRTVTAAIPTIAKVQTPVASVVPGEQVSWRVTVTIPAGVSLYEARILDTLSTPLGTAANATFSVSCGTGWTGGCPTATRLPAPAGSPQVLGVYLDDIDAAPTARILYLDVTSTVLTSTATSVLTANNTARITWNTVDSTPPTTAVAGTATSTTASATAAIRHPAVTVSKAVSNPAVRKAQGEIFTYTVTATGVQNASPNGKTAYHVQVVDTLPEDVIPVVSATDSTPLVDGATVDGGGVWSLTGRTITWTIAELPAATTRTFTYPAKLAVAEELSGSALVNSVVPQSWSSRETGGKSYGPGAEARASVTPAFPLVNAAKTRITGNPVYIGDEVAFQITLTNNGLAKAVSMDAVDTLPAGWSYVEESTTIDGAAADDPDVSGQTLTWADLDELAPSAAHTITYRAVAGPSVSVGGTVAHTNTVRAAEVTDATGGTSYNGVAGTYIGTQGQATAYIHQADLRIAKTAGVFTAGQNGVFQITVTNGGADPAVGVAVTDTLTLPEGVTFVSATGSGWTCTTPTGAGVLTCQRTDNNDTLASGASFPVITVTVAIAADVAARTAVPNTATVDARTEDTNPTNNSASVTPEVTTSADLAVVKAVTTPASGPVTAGEAIEWSVTLTNNGPSVSRAPIVLTDTLPAGVSGVALTGTVPTGCAIAAGVLTCSFADDLAVGASIVVRFGGTVDSSVAAGTNVIVNTATVTPTTTDPVPGNNSSTVRTSVVVEEDLTIVKDIVDPASPAPVVPGESITYRIEVGNRGPSDARGVYVVDTLPDDTTFDELTVGGSAWTATPGAGNTVRFSLTGNLAADASAPALEYTVVLDPAYVGDASDLVNTASVSSTWSADQDVDTAQPGDAAPDADLELTKSVRPSDGDEGDAVIAGETAVYTFTVDNLGSSDAGAVTLTDTLPSGLSFVTPLPAGCTADGQDLTCVKSDGLDVAETPWVVVVTVRVAASFQGSTLTNSAEVESVTSDSVPENNVDHVDLDVVQRAHLTLVKEASDDVIVAGENVVWTITIGNDGPSDAQGVTLEDVLDPRLLLVGADSDDVDLDCSGAASLTCSVGTIPAGEEVVVTITTTVRSSVVDGATIPNTATATSTTPDVDDPDEPATATGDDEIDVEALSELKIVKTTTTPVVTAGDVAFFRITVSNEGPSDAAASVVMTDTLPAGLTPVSVTYSGGAYGWNCAPQTTQVFRCELVGPTNTPVSLAAGATAPVLTVAARVSPSQTAGSLTNTATVSSPTDPTPPTDTATISVGTLADLGIEKLGDGTPTAGEEYTWTVEVTNHGFSDSVATADDPIVVTDELPEGVTFVSATSPDADCTESGGTVTCEITSTLAPDESVTITLTVAVAEDFSGTLSNTAVVAPGLTPEPTTPVWPNESTHTTPPVIEEADLAIEKDVLTDPADIVAGQPIRWQLTVTNLGPSNSDADADTPIVVTDTMPEGVTVDAVTAPSADWSCTIAGDAASLRCELTSDLATGDPQVLVIDATVGPDVQGTITNTATVVPGGTAQPTDAEDNDTDSAPRQWRSPLICAS